MRRELQRIVVVGGGSAGWLTASLLVGRLAARGVEVCVVESPDVPTVGVGEGSTPQMVQCLRALGIRNSEWMPACKATRKMGIRFEGWGRRRFTHPFFLTGDLSTFDELRADDPDFLLHLARAHRDRPDFSLDDLLIANRVTAEPLFGRYVTELADRVSWGAFHFDAGLLGSYLGDWARRHGVRHVAANVLEAERDGRGDIAELRLDTGERLAADVFFDCTGFRGVLIGDALGEPWQSYERSLFCDRALALKLPLDGSRPAPAPFTTSTALSAGWVWQIPLTDALGCGYVFAGAWLGDESAERELRDFLTRRYGDAAGRVTPRLIRFRTGRRRDAWVRNCVSAGLSSNFIEPLEATSIALTLFSVARFLLELGQHGLGAAARDAFNRAVAEENDLVRDFIVMHYASAARRDTPFWRACHERAELSDTLVEVLDAWRRGGRLRLERTFFPELSWFCILTGGGYYPADDVLEAAAGGEGAVAELARRKRRYLARYRDHMRRQLDAVA